MFSHLGKTRTPKHNLGIASLLSFVAGLVNVVGFFAVQKLTTNVTGHFAFFVDEVFKLKFENALHVALFVIFFLFGSSALFTRPIYFLFLVTQIKVVQILWHYTRMKISSDLYYPFS